MNERAVVIGVGNEWRHDDGAGLEVVRRIRARLGSAVHAYELDGEPARIVEAWDGALLAVLVDAVRTGAPPGTRHRFAFESVAATPVWPASSDVSSHALGPLEAYRLGKTLERVPARLVLLGIEAGDVTTGIGLSPTVAAAVTDVVEEIVAIVDDAPVTRSR